MFTVTGHLENLLKTGYFPLITARSKKVSENRKVEELGAKVHA